MATELCTGVPAEARFWQPVAMVEDLASVGGPPLPVRVLGHDLVLWRGAGGVAAFADRCPHRGAALSLGRVVGGQLQCAYHGWRFDPTGRCVRIPAAPDFQPPDGHRAGTWRVAQAHGLWWVARDPVDPAPPACAHVPVRRVVCGPYTVETSAPRLIENFLDTSHFAFVHEGWLGDAAHPEVPAYAVEHTADGRPLIPHYRAWQPRASASSAEGAWVDYRYEVLGPYAALLIKQPEGGGVADAYAAFACPVDEERCRAWFMQFTTDTATPDAELQQFQDTIFGQDRAVLESQRPRRLPISGGEVHSAADRLSAAYRRWLKGVGVGFGVC
ncbi:MAG: aromatic ring-hydroxylating dioxygenase subunit alpha [Burkholderiaceae bacterium]|nr:aromatic ring-hydroxylating dioxygenase subunit alpha [Burkholderiaceae bacterium]